MNKINTLYDSIYGTEKVLSCLTTAEANELSNQLKNFVVRQRKILLRGLDTDIKNTLWPLMTKEITFEENCDLAHATYSIVINKNLLNDKKMKPL